MSKKTTRKANRIASKINAEVFEKNDPNIHICKYCKKPVYLGFGDYGYGVYTATSYGKSKYKSTKSRRHYGTKDNPCIRQWLAEYDPSQK
jgi:hypothetical protein